MLSAIFTAFAVCLDSFIASFSYGNSCIKIPPLSAVIISTIGTAVLSLSMLFSHIVVGGFFSEKACSLTAFSILLVIGIFNLFSNGIRAFLRKQQGSRKFLFNCCGVRFAIDLYLDETKADSDCSKSLSSSEAVMLALALSVDSLASGFGMGLGSVSILKTAVIVFVGGLIAIYGGSLLGRKAKSKIRPDLSWLGGIIMIALAVSKLF